MFDPSISPTQAPKYKARQGELSQNSFDHLVDIYIYQIAVTITAIYVISQELKFHNLGGNNVYDPYDLIASIIGLIGTFVIIKLLGFMENVEIDLKKSE